MNTLPSRTLIVATALLGSVSLAGCAGGGAEAKATPDANVAACEAFETKHNRWVEVEWSDEYNKTQRLTFRDGFASDMDKIALTAEGTVAERLTKLVDELPADATDLLLSFSPSGEAYESNADRVVNACAAEDVAIALEPVKG